MGLDPLRVLGSGALLATIPPDAVEDTLAALEAADVPATVIATVEDAPGATDAGVHYDGTHHSGEVREGIYDLWE
jgi:hydrogenase expression/formation protein HypE